jgi:hypothetical protein
VTPQEIRATLERLREAGLALRRRPAREIVAALGRVLDGLRDPTSSWRRALEAELPEAAGFSHETVREGLARGLAGWSADALQALVEDELGGADRLDACDGTLVTGFGTTAVLLAGSIPMPSLLALLAPLVLRSPVLAKTATRDPVTAPLVADAIAEADPELGRCVAVVSFPGDDAARSAALLSADCVVATGSDATLAEVAARVTAPRRLVAYGHRLSLAVLGREALTGEALAAEARALALDTALWDQLGCLSPVSVYAVGGEPGATERVVEALGEALERAEKRWPRGPVSRHAAALIGHERADAELRAAAGGGVSIRASRDTAWTVIGEADATARALPLHRFLRVHPVSDEAALLAALAPFAAHLAAVAVEGFGARTPELARELARLGASRICRPGALQAPPLAWHHDGSGVLIPLARFADRET